MPTDTALKLVDRFFGQLSCDVKSLKSCALVCRAWRRISQRHLFRDFCIDWQHPIGSSQDVPQLTRRLLRFLTVVPHCCIHIQSFSLTGPHTLTLHLDDLIGFARKMPNLKTLRLQGLRWSLGTVPLDALKCTRITKLALLNLRVESLDHIAWLLEVLPCVTRLDIHNVLQRALEESKSSCIGSTQLPYHTRLQQLNMNQFLLDESFTAALRFTRTLSMKSIRRVDLHWISSTNLGPTGQFLCNFADTIRDLRLGIRYTPMYKNGYDVIQALRLYACVSLNHFTMLISAANLNQFPELLIALTAALSPAIRAITFQLVDSEETTLPAQTKRRLVDQPTGREPVNVYPFENQLSNLDKMDWNHLDLDLMRFRCLDAVYIQSVNDEGVDRHFEVRPALQHFLHDRLPRLHAAERLRFP